MKKLLTPVAFVLLVACNNSKKGDNNNKSGEDTASNTSTTTTTTTPTNTSTHTGSSNTSVNIDGTDINLNGSLLVSKDKEIMQADAPYLVVLTASGGPDNESLSFNFLLNTKPGIYPVVGLGLVRGPSENGQVFGGVLGGKPKLTEYKVNITDVKDLGDNGFGGHKWSISGNFENITIPAMKLMLMDKTKNHPAEVKIPKGSFTNLTFDDNFEEMMEKALDKMNK